jgi:hypothetical protein
MWKITHSEVWPLILSRCLQKKKKKSLIKQKDKRRHAADIDISKKEQLRQLSWQKLNV